jgi:histidyl-tRNA synthetase
VQQLTALTEKLLSGGVQRKPKIPKGTRDYLPEQMMIRQQAFSIIRRVFQSHGAVEIDTPVFELKDTLTGKYGEDSKLIYDLADQGGELLALRYDLTVPFARFLALNTVGNIKRFHIGKVYRRDQPALKRGRYREFYQCDFDIAGVYGRMVPDSECLCVCCDILDALPIGDFAIKVNHRCLLDAILDICGVPADKFRTICSAVDKLDKEPWSEVKREMVEDKGLQESVADKIGEFVLNKGEPFVLFRELMDTKRFGDHKGASQAMEDLRILFEYLEAFDKLKFISFDLSLARGLDYYTGVIYEAVCMSGNAQVGSIGGGGRYDNLVSMFQEAGKQTPCVGVSVGIERVFTLMEARLREEKGGSIKQPNVSVLVASAGGGMMKEKMKIARLLWDANISAEFSQQENAKLKKEVVNALDREIPFMVVVGENELAESKCQVKDIKANTAELVLISELVSTLRKMGVIPVGCEFAAELLRQEDSK